MMALLCLGLFISIFYYLFNVYMNDVVRVVNGRVLGRGLEPLRANGSRFDMSAVIFR